MWEDTGMESVIEAENWIQCQVNRNEGKKKKNETLKENFVNIVLSNLLVKSIFYCFVPLLM